MACRAVGCDGWVGGCVYNALHEARGNNCMRLDEGRVVRVVDSHTEGEPTRVVVEGGPELGSGPMAELRERFSRGFDGFRSGVVCEPRGSEVVVGALLCEPVSPEAAAGVIFFNDVGYLGMCGHGTIGVVTTLAYLGRIEPGLHRIETPVGDVVTELHGDGRVSVRNVPSYRYAKDVGVDVPGLGLVVGDIAWGGNWFFLVSGHGRRLVVAEREELVALASVIRYALAEARITGAGGAAIDHIELVGEAQDAGNSGRNFVLCPGASFDRSPCGTGTSAKMACLYADGELMPGELWRQEGILGTVFTGSVEAEAGSGPERGGPEHVVPTISGRAWITAEALLRFDSADPFAEGIVFA